MPRRLMLFRGLMCAAFGLLFSALAHAEPPIAAFAPGQLRVAEAWLQRAEEALSQHDYKRARVLAAQAGLDARLAYGMSDSSFLRRGAAEVHEQSARLRWLTTQEGLSSLR